MKLLLASAGVTNASIRGALVDLLGKPIAESAALCIPTASYGMGERGAGAAWRFIAGQEPDCPMTALGWKSVGVPGVSVTAFPESGFAVSTWDTCPESSRFGVDGMSTMMVLLLQRLVQPEAVANAQAFALSTLILGLNLANALFGYAVWWIEARAGRAPGSPPPA